MLVNISNGHHLHIDQLVIMVITVIMVIMVITVIMVIMVIMVNMYFHAVKSTAHPPFIGALGHSNDCIVKQSYTFAFVQACCVLLERKLHLQTIQHTEIKQI